MNSDWIDEWKQASGINVCLPGNTSTSELFDIAMKFAAVDDDTQVPALFVFYVWNFNRYPGFRLNDERYSAFPYEKE